MQRPLTQYVLTALAACGVFFTSLSVPFFGWDDVYYVTLSTRTQTPGWAGLANVWSMNDIWTNRFMEFFPLRDTVYWALFQAFGANPLPYHLVSIAAHAVVALLVLALARRLGFAPGVAFAGALIFAVHPIHVESVTWVAGLKDPMFGAFTLGSVLAYLRYRAHGRARDYALMLGLLVAALLCKSIAIAAPLVLLAIDRLDGPPTSWRLTIERIIPPGLIALIFTIQFVIVGRIAHVLSAPHGGSLGSNVLLSLWAFARYLQQAVAPASFFLHYCFAPISGSEDVRLWVALAALAAFFAGVWFATARAKPIAILLLWFLAFLLPVSNLVPFPAVMADRYLYLPSVAASLGIAVLLWRLPPRLRGLALGCVLATFASITVVRGVAWRSEATLWAEVIEQGTCQEDDSSTSAIVFAKDAAFQTDPAVALERYASALTHPAFSQLPPETRCATLSAASQIAKGRDIARCRQYAEAATNTCPWLASAWDTLASAAVDAEPLTAVDAARRALRLGPSPTRQWTLGSTMLRAGQAGGVEQIGAAVSRQPKRLCEPTWRLAQNVEPALREQLLGLPACARPQR